MTYPNLKTLSERLKWARIASGKKQVDVARAVGIKPPTYSELESGKYEQTRYAVQIAKFLGVDPHWLATGKTALSSSFFSQNKIEKIETIVQDEPQVIKEWSEVLKSLGESMKYHYKFVGDMMSGQSGPTIPTNATLLIDQARAASIGDVVLANIGGHPGIGVLSENFGSKYIRPSNTQYPALQISASDIVGVVVSYTVSL